MCTRAHACSVVSNSLRPHGLYPTRLLCSWDFPGKNTGVGCRFFLLRISWPSDRTHVSSSSALARGFFTTAAPGKPWCKAVCLKTWSQNIFYTGNQICEIKYVMFWFRMGLREAKFHSYAFVHHVLNTCFWFLIWPNIVLSAGDQNEANSEPLQFVIQIERERHQNSNKKCTHTHTHKHSMATVW